MRRIVSTYSETTPESAEDGDCSDTGWIDEDGESCEPEDEDETAIDNAVRILRNAGVTEPSSSAFHPGLWYSTEPQVIDYSTGTEREESYHLKGFSEDEEREIYRRMTARRR